MCSIAMALDCKSKHGMAAALPAPSMSGFCVWAKMLQAKQRKMIPAKAMVEESLVADMSHEICKRFERKASTGNHVVFEKKLSPK